VHVEAATGASRPRRRLKAGVENSRDENATHACGGPSSGSFGSPSSRRFDMVFAGGPAVTGSQSVVEDPKRAMDCFRLLGHQNPPVSVLC
jgi:hypothetical protein